MALILHESTPETGADLFVMDLTEAGGDGQWIADGVPRPLVQTPFAEVNGEVSPDGRWLAYQSNASGHDEVYVRRFPEGERVPVSTGGGRTPVWARDGQELLFRSPDGAVMAVDVEPGRDWGEGPVRQVVPAG